MCLGASWGALKAVLGGLGRPLGHFWALLGSLGRLRGVSWGALGGSWGALGRSKIDQKLDPKLDSKTGRNRAPPMWPKHYACSGFSAFGGPPGVR